MEIILIILQVLILLAVGLLALISRYSLSSYLSEKGKNLATKQDIAEITREIESVKATFLEHQTQFSLFHQKRSEAISGTYELLHDATEFVRHMVDPVQFGGDAAEVQRRERGIDAFNKLSSFYWKHKIYLPETICEKMEVVLSTIKEAASNYTIARENHTNTRSLELWYEANKTMRDKVPQLRMELEKLYRETATVSSTQKNDA
jgi:signal transduction protein with GAF and PtsI domain